MNYPIVNVSDLPYERHQVVMFEVVISRMAAWCTWLLC